MVHSRPYKNEAVYFVIKEMIFLEFPPFYGSTPFKDFLKWPLVECFHNAFYLKFLKGMSLQDSPALFENILLDSFE